jgi:oligopeptide/dipeptide ABC transporter ATP-binding protein
MVFQDPFASLNPCIPIGKQIGEALQYRTHLSRKEVRERVLELMALVGIPEPRRRLSAYPDELSGGLRQRVVIASALALSPDLVLADEPTTALDVTIQHQILTLLRKLQNELGMSVIIVSHDLGVVAQTCNRVVVMYAGRVVEEGPVDAILSSPAHPYTKALIDALPQGVGRDGRLRAIPGAPPNLTERPDGCAFAPRCALAVDACLGAVPPLATHAPGRLSACIRHSAVRD